VILGRLDGLLEATHVQPRLLVATHPIDLGRRDAFWLVDGRLVDWGPLPSLEAGVENVAERTEAALARAGRRREVGTHLPPDEVDEVRILTTYLASHPELAGLALDPAPDRSALELFLGEGQLGDVGGGAPVAHGDL
jgi:hypothetical protein